MAATVSVELFGLLTVLVLCYFVCIYKCASSSRDCGVSVSVKREPLRVAAKCLCACSRFSALSVCVRAKGFVYMCEMCVCCTCVCLVVLLQLHGCTMGTCEVA